jgi:hypothetical protein
MLPKPHNQNSPEYSMDTPICQSMMSHGIKNRCRLHVGTLHVSKTALDGSHVFSAQRVMCKLVTAVASIMANSFQVDGLGWGKAV